MKTFQSSIYLAVFFFIFLKDIMALHSGSRPVLCTALCPRLVQVCLNDWFRTVWVNGLPVRENMYKNIACKVNQKTLLIGYLRVITLTVTRAFD